MVPPENGLKADVIHLGHQVDRIDREKASKEALGNVIQDVGEIRADVREIKDVIAARPAQRLAERQADEDARKEEREAEARERKIDRRWRFGTALTCVMVLIAALAFLLPVLNGGTP